MRVHNQTSAQDMVQAKVTLQWTVHTEDVKERGIQIIGVRWLGFSGLNAACACIRLLICSSEMMF